MAAGDFIGTATATLPADGPGEIASVEVTISGVATTSIVNIQPTSEIPSDVVGTFNFWSVCTTNKVTVYANRSQLPKAVSLRVSAWAGA